MKVTIWITVCNVPPTDTDASYMGPEVASFTSYEAAHAYVEEKARQEYKDAVGNDPGDGDYKDWFNEAADQDIFVPEWDITHHDLDLVELINAQKLANSSDSQGEAV